MGDNGNNGKNQRTALIGGTFNTLHEGHKYYIKLAFDYAEEVYILLTSDKYAQMSKSYKVNPYESRKERLENYIRKMNSLKQYHIVRMESDCYLINFCLENDVTMAILIPEYYPLFQKINNIREDEGKNPFLILVTQRIKTREGFKLSSTLINNLKCDQRISPTQYSPELTAYTELPKYSFN